MNRFCTPMQLHRFAAGLVVFVGIGLALAAPSGARGQTTLTTLYSFGGYPYSLVEGSDGNFYGTTYEGGGSNDGTVFKITPSGVLTVLHTFEGGDGAWPVGLVQGSDGNFYGTTTIGGTDFYGSGDGTVFKMTPSGSLTTLYSFCSKAECVDGYAPRAGLVQGSDGSFYGTAGAGGANGDYGTVFRITPSGALTVLYSFDAAPGYYPWAGLVQGSDGNFYGTTLDCGVDFACSGTIFRITPSGALTTLFSSCCSGAPAADGYSPYAGLVQGSDGNFYGTMSAGGANGDGTVFKMTPSGALTPLYSFCSQNAPPVSCTDGKQPETGLVQGSDGNFYGATMWGGANGINQACSGGGIGCGTVFKITPSGTLTTLYSFCSERFCSDGAVPTSVVQGSDGSFYGTTYQGGGSNGGTVFKLVVVPFTRLSRTRLVFPSQGLDTSSAPQTATLSVIGLEPLAITDIAISGADAADFTLTNDCASSLEPRGNCTIDVTFRPTAVGARNASLIITDDEGGVAGSTQTVFLSGTGALVVNWPGPIRHPLPPSGPPSVRTEPAK